MKTAQCSCGRLSVSVDVEPSAVVACHCVGCQRRSGSPFGVGAYYPQDLATIRGESKTFNRPTDSGHPFVTHFCPECGTSLYWYAMRNPGLIGIAVGAFGDPAFPSPVRSVWEQSKHAWIDIDPAQQHHPRGRDS
jgi:hypothetical protein